MKKVALIFAFLLAVALRAFSQDSTPGISFSPPAGPIQPGQSVTITATGNWQTPPTVFCTTDGTPANIAATLVGTPGSGGGVISVLNNPNQNQQTLNCIVAQGAVPYQNVNMSPNNWKICIGDLSRANNGSPIATCTGGVGHSFPDNWNFAWGSTMTQSLTGGNNVQILAPFSAHVCPHCNEQPGTQIMMAQSKTVMATAGANVLSNNEMDMQAIDAVNKIGGAPVQHNFGLQCEQSKPASHPGYWALDGINGWVSSNISDHCPWPANVPLQIVAQAWWETGDTGCGGEGCFHVISLTINGKIYDLSRTVWDRGMPPGTLMQRARPNWSSFFGIQDQMDLAMGGGTGGRVVSNANVTEAYYNPNPIIASATYTAATSADIPKQKRGSKPE